MSSFCQSCGTALGEGNTFCPNCGRQVQNYYLPTAPPRSHSPEGREYYNKSKNRNIAFIASLVIIVLIIGIATYAYANPSASPKTVVTGLNVTIVYISSQAEYFGATNQSVTESSITISAGAQLFQYFIVQNGDPLSSHTINQITVQTKGFTLVSSNPAVPITISAGASLPIDLSFDTSNSAYFGTLAITLITDS